MEGLWLDYRSQGSIELQYIFINDKVNIWGRYNEQFSLDLIPLLQGLLMIDFPSSLKKSTFYKEMLHNLD